MNLPADGTAANAGHGVVAPWLRAAAEDVAALAWLHEAERDIGTWQRLRQTGFPDELSLVGPEAPECKRLAQALDALTDVEENQVRALQDELAADFAAIYLTYALRVSPCESVWLDDDHLMMQAPSFAVRECYRAHGLAATNWRTQADDHLANELGFVAHLLGLGLEAEAADFLDRHLLVWLPRFAQQVEQRAATPIYGALATLTLKTVSSLRAHLSPPCAISLI